MFEIEDGYCAVKGRFCRISSFKFMTVRNIRPVFACSECGLLDADEYEAHLFDIPEWLRPLLERERPRVKREETATASPTIPVDDCPAGHAMDMAVAKVMGLEDLHWGDHLGRSWGSLGFMRPEEEGEVYCLYTQCKEIAPIPAYSSSCIEALTLIDKLCAMGSSCVLEYLPYYGFEQIKIFNPFFETGEIIVKVDLLALAITRAFLKANGITCIERGPRGF